MANRSLRFCSHAGCNAFACGGRYCNAHAMAHAREEDEKKRSADRRRENAHDRGYNYRWSKYSKWFLSQPENQFCVLHLDCGCAGVAQCVDHVRPHTGQKDPLFWERANHQPACIHCNSVKGNREQRGTYVFGEQSQSD